MTSGSIKSTVYLDTNIFLNVIYKELKFATSSAELLKRIQEGKMTAATSSVTALELILDMNSSGFAAKIEEAIAAMEDIRSLAIIPLDQEMSKNAANHVLRDRMTIHDGYHLATALGLRAHYFITRDESLSRKVRKYMKTATPEDIIISEK